MPNLFGDLCSILSVNMICPVLSLLAFSGKNPVRSKICLKNRLLETVNSFSCLGCSWPFTHVSDIAKYYYDAYSDSKYRFAVKKSTKVSYKILL